MLNYQEAIIWLAKRIDAQPFSKEPSLWNALRQSRFDSDGVSLPINLGAKRQVIVCGDPQTIYDVLHVFHTLPSAEKELLVTEMNSNDPLLEWIDILYVPPNALPHFIDQIHHCTLFIEDRLPSWSRALFMKKKIATIVSKYAFSLPMQFQHIETMSESNFTYEVLLDDIVIPEKAEDVKHSNTQLLVDVPKNTVLLLLDNRQANQNVDKVLDDAAATMLDEYWLKNNPSIKHWLPVLIKQVHAFLQLKLKASRLTNKQIVDELQKWSENDKRIT